MTGYGEARSEVSGMHLRVEIRTVNHRYFNTSLRLPDALGPLESSIKDALRSRIRRGHVSCTVRIEDEVGVDGRPPIRVRVDEGRAAAYLQALRSLASTFDLPGEPDLGLLARFGDVLIREDLEEVDADLDADAIMRLVVAAADDTVRMREQEGRRLGDDLRGRVEAIQAALDAVGERAPERLRTERDRLRAAIAELMDGMQADPDRIAQEVAFLADKWDVNEELVRFRSHVELFRNEISGDATEPVGKRLGFLVQEMHREANTIGAKANDSVIAHQVVGIKEEIERLREQVDNVE